MVVNLGPALLMPGGREPRRLAFGEGIYLSEDEYGADYYYLPQRIPVGRLTLVEQDVTREFEHGSYVDRG
jgi:hypothetical protein